jgi:hypothetical protein
MLELFTCFEMGMTLLNMGMIYLYGVGVITLHMLDSFTMVLVGVLRILELIIHLLYSFIASFNLNA